MYSLSRLLVFSLFFLVIPLQANAQEGNDNYDTRTIFQMPKGHFFENIAVGPDNAFYITDYTGKTIHRYTPQNGLSLFTVTKDHPVSLRFNKNGDGLLAVHKVPIFAGPSFTESMAVYQINLQGEVSFLKDLPQAAFLNGMTILDQHNFLIGDAIKGIIWKINVQNGAIDIWLESEALTQEKPGGHIPGVNGIQVYENVFYAANGDRANLLHTTIDSQGNPAKLTVLHENVVVDDFVVDTDKTIYATTHGDTILKIEPDGTTTPIAAKQPAVTGSTAAQFGLDSEGNKSLYVTTDGGLIFGNDSGAKLLRITLPQ